MELINQCVVLLASYFSSGVGDLFRAAIPTALQAQPSERLRDHRIPLTIGDIRDLGYNLRPHLGDLLIDSGQISFQDMGSIARTFHDYFGVEAERDDVAHDVAAGLALRHVIVHNGGVVDRKCIRQLASASPRILRAKLGKGERLQFSSEEIQHLGSAMLIYVERLARSLNRALLQA